MKKLAIWASSLGLLVGLWFTWTNVAVAEDNGNDPNIALVDNCDATTFNAAVGPGTCVAKRGHDTTFTEFLDLLFSPLAANVIGHPAWQFSPGYVSVRPGQTVRVT